MKKVLLLSLAFLLGISAVNAQIIREFYPSEDLKLVDLQLQSLTSPDKVQAEQPETGTIVECARSGEVIVLTGFGTVHKTESGLISKICVQDDGSVYIYNPMTAVATNTWVKAEKRDDGLLVVKGGQLIDNNTNYYFYKMIFNDEYQQYMITDDQDICYEYKDGILTLVSDPSMAVGLVANGGWTGYADVTTEFIPMTDELVVLPENIELEDYVFTHSRGRFMLKGGVDGDNFYLTNIPGLKKEAAMRGTISDGKVTFPSKQLINIDTARGYYFYVCSFDTTTIYVQDVPSSEMVITDDDIVFDYDSDTKTLDTEDFIIFNAGKNIVYYVNFYFGCNIKGWTEVPATPVAPSILYFNDYDEEAGYGIVQFNLTCEDENGNYLNPAKMYYKFYIDEDEYEYDPADHNGKGDPMVEIPFGYRDDYLVYLDELHVLYFDFTSFEDLGIQSIYTGGGERHESEITYVYGTGSGITDIADDNTKQVKSEVITDIMGRVVAEPVAGLYIRTVTYTDGTQESTKFLQR